MISEYRTPVDSAYTALIGHATYAFGYLEWQIVHLAEKLKPGFILTVVKKTAGQVANEFEPIVQRATLPTTLSSDLASVAASFKALVERRNELVHAHPATMRGDQRLNYWTTGKTYVWEPETIDAFIRDVEALAIEGNRLYFDPSMP